LSYRILITETCISLINKISDKKIQRTILDRLEQLSEDPDKQGKNLVQDLSGFRSVHAAGRYRIIYKIEKKTVIVYVLAAGIRKEGDKKDIYKIAKKLLKAGLLDLEVE
jgi:mRNA interferase RelE/StbE